MDAIAAIRHALISPFAAAAIIIILFFPIKRYFKSYATLRDCLLKSLVTGTIFAGLSLVWVVAKMITYAYSTGKDPNQGPLVWMFLYGPISFGVGELAGFIVWLLAKRIVF
jgi:hypothetical protein